MHFLEALSRTFQNNGKINVYIIFIHIDLTRSDIGLDFWQQLLLQKGNIEKK